jgi:hypothetical protein
MNPELHQAPNGLIGASCSLNADEMRQRLADWRGIRDRAVAVTPIPSGARLTLAANEPMPAIAALVSRESDCCPFYTFTMRIHGPSRELDIGAGAGGESAVHALIGLDE